MGLLFKHYAIQYKYDYDYLNTETCVQDENYDDGRRPRVEKKNCIRESVVKREEFVD